MNGFLWRSEVSITISKLLEAETKLKLTYIIHLKWTIYVNFIYYLFITWMLFALQVPYSQFCKDGLMMVKWPKHVVIKIKYNNILLCLTETNNYFVVFQFNKHNGMSSTKKIQDQVSRHIL
jgi:hypothetical protein